MNIMHKIAVLTALLSMPVEANNVDGQWSDVGDWPFVAIHAALLPDGRVVTYGSDGDVIDGTDRGGRGRTGQFLYDVWDPTLDLGDLSHMTLENTTSTDLFCSAQILLPDSGDMLIAGGDTYTPESDSNPVDKNDNRETDATTIIRPSSDPEGLYDISEGTRMQLPRWYATPSMLPNGDIFIQGGKGGEAHPEILTRDGEYILKTAIDTENYDYWYPRNFVAPDGRIFGFGASDGGSSRDYTAGEMYNIWPDGEGYVESVGVLEHSEWYSSTVMFAPGKALHVSAKNNEAVIIDFNGRQPLVTATSPLNGARKWLTLTLLADGKVLATGGSERNGHGKDVGEVDLVTPIYNAVEIWDPQTGQWSSGASAVHARLYHSIAILLPDARVLTAGGGLSGPFIQHNGEVYSPPYLFQEDGSAAVRPVINTAPELADYGEMISIGVENAVSMSAISLVKMGSVTHSYNVEQRILKPSFTASGQTISFRAPSNPNLATPGFYMLFVFDEHGVPSIASIMKIDGDAEFEITENAGIPGYNEEILYDQHSESCKQACVDRSWCKSADFARDSGVCYLQPVAEQDVSLKNDYSGNPYDHFSYMPRHTPEGFGVALNAGISGHNQEIMANTDLPSCQSACIDRGWCKSIDFERDTEVCFLQPVAEEDVDELKRDYAGDPYDHYFYEPRLASMYGWAEIANAGIPGHNIETHYDTPLAECQALCSPLSWCKSVDFNRNEQICYLQDVDQNDAALNTQYSGNPYDHYFKSNL